MIFTTDINDKSQTYSIDDLESITGSKRKVAEQLVLKYKDNPKKYGIDAAAYTATCLACIANHPSRKISRRFNQIVETITKAETCDNPSKLNCISAVEHVASEINYLFKIIPDSADENMVAEYIYFLKHIQKKVEMNMLD